MIEGTVQPALQLAHSRNDSGIHERIEIAVVADFFAQRVEVPKELHVFFRERGHVGVGKNFNQGNFEWRKRQRTIQSVAVLLPLTWDAGMAIKKSRNKIGLVAIDLAGFAATHKVTQQ